jgi:hypothetical protein
VNGNKSSGFMLVRPTGYCYGVAWYKAFQTLLPFLIYFASPSEFFLSFFLSLSVSSQCAGSEVKPLT